MDQIHSFVSISPGRRVVEALFFHGYYNVVAGIPHQFEDYSIDFPNNTQVADADLKTIFRWKNVVNLKLSGGKQFTQQLSSNWVKFLQMSRLKRLSIEIQRDSYAHFHVNSLLEAPKLREAIFDGSRISDKEFGIFVSNQHIPSKSKFRCKVVDSNKYRCKQKWFC